MPDVAGSPRVAEPPLPTPAPHQGTSRRQVLLGVLAVVAVATGVGLYLLGRAADLTAMQDRHVQDVAVATQRWEQAYLGAGSAAERDRLKAASPFSTTVGEDPPEDFRFLLMSFSPTADKVVVIGRVVTASRQDWLRVAVDVSGSSSWCLIAHPTGDPEKDTCTGPTITP